MFLLSPLKSKYGSIVKTLSVPLELSAQVELPRLSEAWLRPEAKPGLVCIHHPWPELLSGQKGSCERARGPLVRSHGPLGRAAGHNATLCLVDFLMSGISIVTDWRIY